MPGSVFVEGLAATYSRASYTGTTIGNAVFDGRVRNGNGSDHNFMATKKANQRTIGSLKTAHRLAYSSRAKSRFWFEPESDQASRPISISPLNASRRLHA